MRQRARWSLGTGQVRLNPSWGPKIFGDPYAYGKNQMVFFSTPPSASPSEVALGPGHSFVFQYSEKAATVLHLCLAGDDRLEPRQHVAGLLLIEGGAALLPAAGRD